MKEPQLVILAAGMGSRYGGLKQIDEIGNHGESIIDFSIFDAIKAGFRRVALIIREEFRAAVEEKLGRKIRPYVDLIYIDQNIEELPEGYVNPEGRIKPWGTTHALLACKGKIDGPFAIINADDYYGPHAYKQIYDFLKNDVKPFEYAIVAFKCVNTLSENGSVTRGLCQEKDGWMCSIEEIQEIYRKDDAIFYKKDDKEYPLSGQEPISMNYWGFDENIFELADEVFREFLEREYDVNSLKCEHVIPTMVKELLEKDKIRVKMLTSEDNWFGVTYREDKPLVAQMIQRKKDEGLYPENLWEE